MWRLFEYCTGTVDSATNNENNYLQQLAVADKM